MRYNVALDVATERSKDLFTLPGVYSALLLNIVTIALPGGGLHALGAHQSSMRYLYTSTLFSVTSFLSVWRSAEYFDPRRSLWTSFFVTVPLALGVPLEGLGIPFCSLCYTSLLLASLISWSMGKSLRSKALPFILAGEAILVNGWSLQLLSALLIPMISAHLVGAVVGSVTEPVVGLRGFDGVRALADIVLGDSGTSLEERLVERGVKGFATYDIVRLGNSVITTADVHPGPFRMGSHDLPKKIVLRLRDVGLDPIFLRRACSHERNLASSGLADDLVEEIVRSVDKASSCCVGEPVFVSSDEFEVSAQRFGEVLLFTVSGRPLESFEDIPYEIEGLLAEELGVRVSVVDRHDSLRSDWYEMAFVDSELGRKLVEILLRAGRAALQSKCANSALAGYRWDDPRWPSVGPGGVGVLTMKVGDVFISYMMIDGNNMIPELRDLIDDLSPPGVRVIVSTTDTHETISTKNRYNPVGSECRSDECLKERASYLIKLVEESIDSMTEVEVRCYRGEVETVFMGSELMAMLSSLMRSSKLAKPLLGLAMLPQIVLPLLWI